ncbi:hypothetical protein UWK_02909 [Desulfocapsa sulfexigens DSM 10523]|uniref:DUF211 domain-containing protein n=1 Tax=Desulfocapsa sulfexigens (strain DSM 10523 / SB164P1) TaxID=1167006 RepID=M1PIM4_DESSD|nr:DUF211 domain-containing protein [Desulfocapsa sulfexigens]AGF79440.1 hypothetical protein UWK_02909 [Desulfocapsa sulfexigens DSM 10523]
MTTTRKIVLDVLKPHKPNGVDFATALAQLSPDYHVRLSVVEMDAKTESVIVVVEGNNIAFDSVSELIKKMGASIHSIDEVEVHGSETI